MPQAAKKTVSKPQAVEEPVIKKTEDQLRLARLEDAIIAISDRITKVPPVIRSDARESADYPIEQGEARNLPSTGQARLDPASRIVVERVASKEKQEALAFAEEIINVRVETSAEKYAEPIVEVWCDGRIQLFVRGRVQPVKRKYVEVLARSQPTSYDQEKYRDENNIENYREIPNTAARYNFTVIGDNHPKAEAWLAYIKAQG